MSLTEKRERRATTVALVEDDVPFRGYIGALVNSSEGCRVVLEASSVEDALRNGPGEAPRVLLLDIDLPGASGAASVGRFLTAWPGVSVIMLSGLDRDDLILEAIQAGAQGYLRKGADSGELLDALDDVLAGGAPMSPAIARRVLALLREAPTPTGKPATAESPLPILSARERQVVALVAAGLGDKEIAAQLGTAVSTVKNQLASVYGKWRVRSRTEAAVKFSQATAR